MIGPIAFLAGGTGLTGSNILETISQHSAFSKTVVVARRTPKAHDNSSISSIVNADTSQWPDLLVPAYSAASSSTAIFFSALGTTRATAGGLANQRKIDHDLPVSLIRSFAARPRAPPSDTPTRSVAVLISSSGANPSAFLAYPKMKGETEEAFKALLKGGTAGKEQVQATHAQGLDHVVILRPGLIVGARSERRVAEAIVRGIASFAGLYLGNWAKDFWAQDVDVIAKAAVNAGLQCAEGKITDKVWVLGQSDIIRLGRTEWSKAT